MKSKKAIVSVINDLVTDQRVDRACRALQKSGYEVLLVGRVLRNSLPMNDRPYSSHRMKLFWKQGPIFYLEFQIRLFFFLLNKKADLFYSNDLDTLLPNYLCSRLKSARIIYDSHELFCEVPELLENPAKRKIWKGLEQFILPKLETIITVNQSIADIYSKEYRKEVKVVRNIPLHRPTQKKLSREELNLPQDKNILILQGAGINVHRGAEEAVQAMQYLDHTLLLIVGGGDVIDTLKQMREDLNLQEKVIITGKVAYEKLAHYTQVADLGLSLDRDTNLNYRYSLPNKLFDYIHAGIPVLVSPLVEISSIVNQYKIGSIVESHDPKHIAEKISNIFSDKTKLKQWKKNLIFAQQELNWAQEEQNLIACIPD